MKTISEIREVISRYKQSKNTDLVKDYVAAMSYIDAESPNQTVTKQFQNEVIETLHLKVVQNGLKLKDVLSNRNKQVQFEASKMLDQWVSSTTKELQDGWMANFISIYDESDYITRAFLNHILKIKTNQLNQANKLRGIETKRVEEFQIPTSNKYQYINEAIEQLTKDVTSKEELLDRYSKIGLSLADRINNDGDFEKHADKQKAYAIFSDSYRIALTAFEVCEDDYDIQNPKYIPSNETFRQSFYNRLVNCSTQEQLDELVEQYGEALGYRHQFFKIQDNDALKMLEQLKNATLTTIKPIENKIDIDWKEIYKEAGAEDFS